MRFPDELWPDPAERELVSGLLQAFPEQALILTDRLVNSVYLSDAAERAFGERAEALVNRLGLSLLGFGEKDRIPAGLVEALDGSSSGWEGIVQLQAVGGPLAAFVQASAIRSRSGSLIAGVIRIGKVQAR
ncbi:hypothetical protein GC173_10310 [bacterium]|nr:hypothetical protein [bacterium]